MQAGNVFRKVGILSGHSGTPEAPRVTRTLRDVPRNEDFENKVTAKLDRIHRHILDTSNDLRAELPIIIRQAVQEELSQALVATQPSKYDATQVSHADEEIAALTANNVMLQRKLEEQERIAENLRADLSKKTNQARKLHEIILQSGQDSPDIADADVEKKFGELCYAILHIVNRHFSGAEGRTHAKQLHDLSKDDRILCLRSTLADAIYQKFFRSSVRLFGLDESREKAQVELEGKLIERQVPKIDVDEWRVKTVKVCRAMQLKKAYNYPHLVADALFSNFEDYHTGRDKEGRPAARQEMYDLCARAFELSLTLRESKSKFEWGQGEAPSAIDPTQVEPIGPYNMKSNFEQARPVRVMFGPVWKIVDGDPILLKKGEVLNGK
ncbi:MAG: hypothetical protein Q9227_001117 [Pyrenula ochraceoflavens]